MGSIKSSCPSCGNKIEFDLDSKSVICLACTSAYLIQTHGGSLSLTPLVASAVGVESEAIRLLDDRLIEIDDLLVEGEAELDAAASRIQGGPLRFGCSLFGLFFGILLVIIVFMLIGRSYFGGWLFYLVIVAVVALGLIRLRSVWPTLEQKQELSSDYDRISKALSDLQTERDRVASLKNKLTSGSSEP